MKIYYCKQVICISALALFLSLGGCKDSPKDPDAPSTTLEESLTEIATTPEKSKQETILIKDINGVSAGVSPSNPDINLEAVDGIQIQNTAASDIKGLLRLPLPSAMLPDDVVSAKLRLKRQSGENTQLRGIAVGNVWDRLGVTWNTIQENLVTNTATDPGEFEEDDWYVLDITGIVQGWLSGAYGNSGILLEEMEKDSSIVFYSPYTEIPDYCPELVITYTPSHQDNFGTFTYEKQEKGNCLSFALQDKDGILAEDLGINTKILQQKFNAGGSTEALGYLQELVSAYVKDHADALKITSFREISSFDAEIDPETEYRIALRIGLETEEGLEDLPRGRASFDYHLQVQLLDGSWAEKFGASTSRIVPGSNGVVDPGLDAWDQNEIWGMSKFSAYYDSSTVYYAVRKNSDAFTSHLQ